MGGDMARYEKVTNLEQSNLIDSAFEKAQELLDILEELTTSTDEDVWSVTDISQFEDVGDLIDRINNEVERIDEEIEDIE
jgi:archaellum component FlaC